VNLSLGGPFDSSVYGCGFSPICKELRDLWQRGVLICVAAGNEGQIEVSTADGAFDLNTSLSIGDPANLEECIAVGSVHTDKPHFYGVSYFSSRGPTADGRRKPDVVAPGERITSCNSDYDPKRKGKSFAAYREDSGTSMACPHVSGLLAAFLSVRREYIDRPDEVKELLTRTCTDIARDRYHQGHGVPNLMRMLLDA
jgi:subtilisin family serine protease